MRDRLVLLVWLVMLLGLVGALGACGKEIGDPCFNLVDCSPNGDRTCIDATANVEGYCTIQGCDYSTCPEEAACIRFFSGSFSTKACDPVCDSRYHPDDPQCKTPAPGLVQCSPDEFCPLEGHCVARSAETRYCMRTCGSDGDCRDGYECRDLERMRQHGGQPVLAPVELADGRIVQAPIDDDAPKFCAKAP